MKCLYEIRAKFRISGMDFSILNRDRTAYIEIWINAMRYRKCGFMDFIRSTNRATAITWLLRRRPSLKSKWVAAGHRDDDDDDNDDDRYDVPIYDDRWAATPMIHGRSLAPACPSHSLLLYSLILPPFISQRCLFCQYEITNGGIARCNCNHHFRDLLFTKFNPIGRSLEAALKLMK